MDKFDKLVKEIMLDAEKDGEPVTEEEAKEMARMELGAKQIKRYEQAEKPRKKRAKPKTVKVSDEKVALFNEILENLTKNHENVTTIKQNKLIQVQIEDKIFKIDLIQQRSPKK